DFGRGFSIFSNIVLAILSARAQGKVRRVAVVDWDVHHGNGTQDAFYSDPSVLTISLHQAGYYPPDSGWLDEMGDGAGRGYNINVPLPAGSGHGAYVETVKQVVLPALRRFGPELIMVASGLDANAQDPLARMMCHSGTFREMATLVKSAAEELCGGRLVAWHEGGYAPAYGPWSALAIMETFAGIETCCRGPALERIARWPGQELQTRPADVVAKAASLVQNSSLRLRRELATRSISQVPLRSVETRLSSLAAHWAGPGEGRFPPTEPLGAGVGKVRNG